MIHNHVEIVQAAPTVRFFDSLEHRLFRFAYEAALNLPAVKSSIFFPSLFEAVFQAAAMSIEANLVISEYKESSSFYVRGVVSPLFAALAVKYQGYGEELPGKFRHVWLRLNPDPSQEYAHFVVAGKQGQRGSFKATVLDPEGTWGDAPLVPDVDAYANAQDVRNGYPDDVAAAWHEFKGRYVQ